MKEKDNSGHILNLIKNQGFPSYCKYEITLKIRPDYYSPGLHISSCTEPGRRYQFLFLVFLSRNTCGIFAFTKICIPNSASYSRALSLT